jgi:hypothetical protein
METKRDDSGATNPLHVDAAAVYYSLLSVRNQEVAIAWMRYNIFAVLNVGLAAAFLTQSTSRWMTLGVGVIGLVLAIAWLQTTRHGWRYLCGRWEGYIIRFEEKLPDGSCIPRMFTEIAIKEGRMKVGGPAPTEDTVSLPFQGTNYRHYVPLMFVLLWALLAILACADRQALLRC